MAGAAQGSGDAEHRWKGCGGQVRHGSATPVLSLSKGPRTPSEQQYSDQASLATLSREPEINPKTVAKWRMRARSRI